jgi:hypothetical protein
MVDHQQNVSDRAGDSTMSDRTLERLKYGAYFVTMPAVGVLGAWLWQNGTVGYTLAALTHIGWQPWLE